MADSFGIVVHGFNDALIDSKIKVSKDSFLMTSEHPGKLSEGFEAATGCPPVCVQRTGRPGPALQILCCPGFALIVPQSSEQLFQQVCPDDLKAALLEHRKGDLLVFGKVL